jgi:hypothetical protein
VQFNITFDASVNNAPVGFTDTVLKVANFYASTFTDNVTVNLNVGFGEVGGSALPSSALGASLTYLASTTYKTLASALKIDRSSSAADQSSTASLPATDPTGAGHYWVTTAEGKALGIYAGSGLDGSIGFSSTAAFDYNTSDGVAAGSYDFFGTVAHEFSEVMGRMLLTGERISIYAHSYSALDLFHYAASGVRDFLGTKAGYFSVDKGVTHLQNFNTNSAGDYGDWSSAKGVDAFNAFATIGKVAPISSADLTALDVIGWNGASGGTTTTSSGVTSVQQADGHAHDHSGGAFEQAMLSVGKHLATDLSYYYGV